MRTVGPAVREHVRSALRRGRHRAPEAVRTVGESLVLIVPTRQEA